MRIGIDVRAIGPHFPGVGRATLGLLGGLHELEHDDRFVLFHQPAERAALDDLGLDTDERFAFAAVEAAPLGLAQQLAAPRAARAQRLAVWHAPYYFRPFWGLPPAVVTVFDTIGPAGALDTDMVLPANTRARRVWRIAMRLSMRAAARVITSSEAAGRDLQAGFGVPPAKLSVIPLAADARFQPQSLKNVDALRMKHGLPERYVLYLGSNKPHKNIVSLVEAWAEVLRAAPERAYAMPTRLVLAGREDPRYRNVRERVAELGLGQTVQFLPDVDDADLPPLLAGAALFVFPSLYEGFGLPPLEAMACGTAVIASNRASLPEVVGDGGLLVEPWSGAIARAMARVLADEDLRRELKARGLKRAAHFSWKRTAAETLHLYHELAR